jgi:predicted dehydrogenase
MEPFMELSGPERHFRPSWRLTDVRTFRDSPSGSRRGTRGANLLWEINGSEGDLQLTATGGQAQIWELDVRGGKGDQSTLELLPVPEKCRWVPPQTPGPSTNVAQAYAHFARDYREGTHLCPTFEDAVTRHRMLKAIETAAATGKRQMLG